MSKHQLPFHIQEEIMKRLPVKSLIQFRSVSKAWKSLIDSSEFIAAQVTRRHTRPQHLLVWYGVEYPAEAVRDEVKYVGFVDDDTFPQRRYVLPLPPFLKQLFLPIVIGSSHGLVCLYASDSDITMKLAVIWNPSIRKSVVVPLRVEPDGVGFGVCPVTNDPKIVAINQSKRFDWFFVMVYSLNSGKWNPSANLPTIPIRDPLYPVVTDRFIYWVAGLNFNMIMSFDITNEIFEEIALPDSVGIKPTMSCSILKLHKSLAMLRSGENNWENNWENNSTIVWMMEDGVQRSFTKLFVIQAPYHKILGFRKSGIPIMVAGDDRDEKYEFVVYEPNLRQDNVLEITERTDWFNMTSYVETLLLLDRSDELQRKALAFLS